MKNQKGFTLIELLVALAITGLISTGIARGAFQVFEINALSSDRVIAITEVENAGYWITRDAKMAQSIIADTETLTLAWVGYYESDVSEVRYTDDGSGLCREVTTYDSSGQPVETATIWLHTAIAIDGVITITASVGDAEEARTYEY